MSGFEFFFGFMGLVLGLALANVAAGFGKLWRIRSTGNTGWCIPLLAILILARIITIWNGTWHTFQEVEINSLSLLVAAGVALPYVLVSTLMFPEDEEKWLNLDSYYLGQSRLILAALTLPPVVFLLGVVPVLGFKHDLLNLTVNLALLVGPLLVMLVWRRLWFHRLMLSLMIIFEFWTLLFL